MTYFLQMDGVDDKLLAPSMTFTEIVIDFKLGTKVAFGRYWTLPFGAEYFQVASGAVNDQWSAGVSALYLNGVSQTNLSPIVTAGTRALVRSVTGTTKTGTPYFMSSNSTNYLRSDIWNIKIYNGATLMAHYDMSTQTVLDQSGNGRHATLTGGTWVDDGSGGDVGVDVSYTFTTKQSIYANRIATISTTQQVSANRVSQAPTQQRIYALRQSAASTLQRAFAVRITDALSKQNLYADRSYSYAIHQLIQDDGVDVSYGYGMRQIMYASLVFQVPTRQRFFADRSQSYPLLIRIYDPAAPSYVQTIYFTVNIKRRNAAVANLRRSHEADVTIARIKRIEVRI